MSGGTDLNFGRQKTSRKRQWCDGTTQLPLLQYFNVLSKEEKGTEGVGS